MPSLMLRCLHNAVDKDAPACASVCNTRQYIVEAGASCCSVSVFACAVCCFFLEPGPTNPASSLSMLSMPSTIHLEMPRSVALRLCVCERELALHKRVSWTCTVHCTVRNTGIIRDHHHPVASRLRSRCGHSATVDPWTRSYCSCMCHTTWLPRPGSVVVPRRDWTRRPSAPATHTRNFVLPRLEMS